MMWFKKNRKALLKEPDSLVEIEDIKYFIDGICDVVPFLHELPIRFEGGWAQDIEDVLFDPTQETNAAGVFACEVILCELHLEVEPSEEIHEEKDS